MAGPGILDVNGANVEQTGFFCTLSKRKAEGFQKHLEWLRPRNCGDARAALEEASCTTP